MLMYTWVQGGEGDGDGEPVKWCYRCIEHSFIIQVHPCDMGYISALTDSSEGEDLPVVNLTPTHSWNRVGNALGYVGVYC